CLAVPPGLVEQPFDLGELLVLPASERPRRGAVPDGRPADGLVDALLEMEGEGEPSGVEHDPVDEPEDAVLGEESEVEHWRVGDLAHEGDRLRVDVFGVVAHRSSPRSEGVGRRYSSAG